MGARTRRGTEYRQFAPQHIVELRERVRRTPVPPTLQSLANRNLKTWQIGPAMKHNSSVDGAVLTKDETRILSWSGDHTVRLWDDLEIASRYCRSRIAMQDGVTIRV